MTDPTPSEAVDEMLRRLKEKDARIAELEAENARLDRLLTVRDEQLQQSKQQHFQCMMDLRKAIERCSQVAENYKWEHTDVPRGIAAKIRALKDKP